MTQSNDWNELEQEAGSGSIDTTKILPSLSGIDTATLAPMLGIYGLSQPGRPEYLFPEQHSRSLFQQMTINCGLSYGTGLAIGGMVGAFQGLRSQDATNAKLRLNAVLNGVGKRGAKLGNSLGILALFYTGLENTLASIRDKNDVYNEIGGATLTGLLYKSSRGLRTATAAGLLAGSALGIFGSIRQYVTKHGYSSLRPKLN